MDLALYGAFSMGYTIAVDGFYSDLVSISKFFHFIDARLSNIRV